MSSNEVSSNGIKSIYSDLSSISSLNINTDQIYVKSRNTEFSNIIGPYEITSSTDMNLSLYSPVLTQSLSLSQSIFVI